MILVANLHSSASFRCEKIFKIVLGTMLFCCRVNICWANAFTKLPEATAGVFRVYLKISQISHEKICAGVSYNKSFLMTSFAYIFPCPFTLLHLLPIFYSIAFIVNLIDKLSCTF